MDEESLVIRKEKIAIEKALKKSGFAVVVVHGPGGTGKTSLIRTVRSSLNEDDILSVYIKGTKKEIDNHVIVKLTDVMTSDLLTSMKLAGINNSKFPQLRKARDLIDRFDDLVAETFDKDIDLETKKVTDLSNYLSMRLADLLIMSQTETLDSGVIIDDRVRSSVESKVGKILRDNNFSSIKNFTERWDLLAESIAQDFKKVLEGRHGFWGRKRFNGGVLIIDNYEYLSRFLRIFFEQHLIPFLESYKINLKLLLVTRDAIDDFPETNVKNISLGPFSNDEAKQYLMNQGITNERKVVEIIQRTKRYPYLMDFEVMASSQSAKSLQKYFERITRWMTSQQKEWLVALSYLKFVDKSEVKKVVATRDVEAVMKWFKEEPSVRCPENGKWKIIPLMSERIHSYIQVEDPELDRSLREKAAGEPFFVPEIEL